MTKITRLILPIILLIIGIQFTRDYFGDTSKERRLELNELISNGEETTAFLDDEYTEKTTKIAKIPVKTYEIGYKFNVQEVEYSGKKSLKSPPEGPTMTVTYLPSDPETNMIDPAGAIASLDEYENNSTTLIIGVVLILAGIGLGALRFKSLKKSNPA